MTLNRSDMTGFSRGLITDAIGVDGALLEANDVVITREGELRKRGGKPNRGTITSAGEGLSGVYNAACSLDFGSLVNYQDTATYYRLGRRAGGSTFGTLGTARTNSAGAIPTGFWYDIYWSMFMHNGELMTSGGWGNGNAPARWKGSQKAEYATGTISTTSGSTTITGAGTSWLANIEPGMYLHINSGTLLQRTFLVKSVASNTSLVVDQAPDATVAGVGYKVMPVGVMSAPTGIFGWGAYPLGYVACSHQGRVFIAQTYETGGITHDERIRWSATPNETSGKFIGCDYWHANAYTDVAVGDGGVIKGLASMGSELVILKNGAVYALRGLVATDGSDLGASVSLISSTHGCNGRRGYVKTRMGLVFCDGRGAFLYRGGGSEIVSLTEGRVQRDWEANVTSPWVSAVGDRVIFNCQDSGYILSYDIATDTWTTQSAGYWAGVIQTYAASNSAPEYELGIRRFSDGVDDWGGDLETDGGETSDALNAAYPAMRVMTHPIQLASPVGNARPVRVDVNGYATGGLTVAIACDRRGNPAREVGTIPAGSADTAHRLRIPPGSSSLTAYAIVHLTGTAMADARLYGVSILSAPSGRVDP